MRKKNWFLTFDQTRIDVTLIIERGKIVAFSLNLSIEENGEKHDVVRWDTAHGYLHKHEFWRTTKTIKEKYFEKLPLDKIFVEVYRDLLKNWEKYVKKIKGDAKNEAKK